MSAKEYIQGDCGITRAKFLSTWYYKKPMGEEIIKEDTYDEPNP